MKFIEIKTGTVFTLGETPSYPKLKIDEGYVDMRDEIVNTNPNPAVLNASVRELTAEEIAKVFSETVENIETWIKEKKEKFL